MGNGLHYNLIERAFAASLLLLKCSPSKYVYNICDIPLNINKKMYSIITDDHKTQLCDMIYAHNYTYVRRHTQPLYAYIIPDESQLHYILKTGDLPQSFDK
jgi:hypothetical protein